MLSPHLFLRSQSADEELALIEHFWWETVVQRDEQLLMADDLSLPLFAIDGFQLLELFPGKFESIPDDVGVLRNPADRRLGSLHTPTDPVDDPFEHTHVLRVTGPQQCSILAFAEPIDVEYPR